MIREILSLRAKRSNLRLGLLRRPVGLLAMTIILLSSNLWAAEPTFSEANKLYAEGKFSEAAKIYEALAKTKPSAEIYYNLGNAYFKANQIGKAILNYERAKRLAPRDGDVRANLAYVNRLIEYKVEDKRNFYVRQTTRLVSYFKFEECWLLFLASYSIFLIVLLIALIRKHPLFGRLSAVLLTLLIISSCPMLLKFGETGMKNEAVVTVKQAEVRYGPSTQDRIAFRLVEGLKVTLPDHKEDWYRIRLLDGRSGWIRDSEISII